MIGNVSRNPQQDITSFTVSLPISVNYNIVVWFMRLGKTDVYHRNRWTLKHKNPNVCPKWFSYNVINTPEAKPLLLEADKEAKLFICAYKIARLFRSIWTRTTLQTGHLINPLQGLSISNTHTPARVKPVFVRSKKSS